MEMHNRPTAVAAARGKWPKENRNLMLNLARAGVASLRQPLALLPLPNLDRAALADVAPASLATKLIWNLYLTLHKLFPLALIIHSSIMVKKDKPVKPELQPATRELTIHLKKYTLNRQFKRRTKMAMKVLRRVARKEMKTHSIKIDQRLNAHMWSRGIANPPIRVRVRLSRKRDEDEDAKEKFYTLISWVPTTNFHYLSTNNVQDTAPAASS